MDPKTLREELARRERELSGLRGQLSRAEETCRHAWSAPVYDPIVREAYTEPGDPPGTMGVDWRGPVFVPAQTTPRWRRECSACGRVEYTTRAEQQVTPVPRF